MPQIMEPKVGNAGPPQCTAKCLVHHALAEWPAAPACETQALVTVVRRAWILRAQFSLACTVVINHLSVEAMITSV
jgi:hypothetical protein